MWYFRIDDPKQYDKIHKQKQSPLVNGEKGQEGYLLLSQIVVL